MAPFGQNLLRIKFNNRFLISLFIGLLLGFLMSSQAVSVDEINQLLERDVETNAFKQMQAVYRKNLELQDEARGLADSVNQYSDRASVLEAVQQDIERYEKIAGARDIKGAGIEIVIETNQKLAIMWLVDLYNELLNLGAEAVSIQNIRLVDGNMGFDSLPNGSVYLNGVVLNSPFSIKVIGPQKEIISSLEQANSGLSRLKRNHPEIKISIEAKNSIFMEGLEKTTPTN
jgi:uncharacterized protein YlxW (UPF0749 family)